MLSILLAAAACTGLAQPVPDSANQSIAPVARLHLLLDEHVEWLKRHDPLSASTKGDLRFNDQLGDSSPAAHEQAAAEIADRLKRLESIDPASTPGPAKTDYGILRFDLATQVPGAPFHREQIPISTMG